MDTRVVVVVILAICWKFWPGHTLIKDKLEAEYDYLIGRCVPLLYTGQPMHTYTSEIQATATWCPPSELPSVFFFFVGLSFWKFTQTCLFGDPTEPPPPSRISGSDHCARPRGGKIKRKHSRQLNYCSNLEHALCAKLIPFIILSQKFVGRGGECTF